MTRQATHDSDLHHWLKRFARRQMELQRRKSIEYARLTRITLMPAHFGQIVCYRPCTTVDIPAVVVGVGKQTDSRDLFVLDTRTGGTWTVRDVPFSAVDTPGWRFLVRPRDDAAKPATDEPMAVARHAMQRAIVGVIEHSHTCPQCRSHLAERLVNALCTPELAHALAYVAGVRMAPELLRRAEEAQA